PAPVAAGPEGSRDVSFGEQNLSFTTADVTEIEYTQLQHILYSHMEAQASGGEVEARFSSFSLPGSSADPFPQQSSLKSSQEGCLSGCSGNQSMYPVTHQAEVPSDSTLLSSNPRFGHADLQELTVMLLSESTLLWNQTCKSGSVEALGHDLVRVKCDEYFAGMNKENTPAENLALAPEPRPKSTVRVRLEDKFNSIQQEKPRCQEPQESGVTLNNLVTLICQPSEVVGAHQQESKCVDVGRTKTPAPSPAPSPAPLQFPPPLFAMSSRAAAGSANTAQAQPSGASCNVMEAAKHQDLGIPKTMSFCCQETESTKQAVAAVNKALPEEVWVKLGGDTLCKQEMNRSSHSPGETKTNRKPLAQIQNLCVESQSFASAQVPWQSSPSMQMHCDILEGINQRRERHNRLERDRRWRRIRLCCDELNLLVPFCTADTDKATTLQWTTAFLKYIKDRFGDSLKQDFETVFCAKRGKAQKLASSDSFVTQPVQENTRGFGNQV
ncbi:TCFL5 protein, partial [Galbula dea]|nr:TCFL5 protein [Galbula dea]